MLWSKECCNKKKTVFSSPPYLLIYIAVIAISLLVIIEDILFMAKSRVGLLMKLLKHSLHQ